MKVAWIRVEAGEVVRNGWILDILGRYRTKISSLISYGIWREEKGVKDYTKIFVLNT